MLRYQDMDTSNGDMRRHTEKRGWIKTSTLVLGLGIFLGVVGVSLLLGFGIGYVGPYMEVQNMRSGSCAVTLAVHEEPLVTCACGRGSCQSKYPCLKMLVNMTVETEQLPEGRVPGVSDNDTESESLPFVTSDNQEQVTIHNVTLYDSYETFLLQYDTRKCSYHQCDRKYKSNFDGADAFYNAYGNPVGLEFMCYFDPVRLDFAIVSIITKTTVIHAMLWPSIAVVVAIVILGLSLSEKGQQASKDQSPGGNNARSSPTFDLRYPGHRQGVEYEIIES